MAMVGLLALISWSAQAAHDVPGWRAGAAASFFDFQGDDVPDPALGDKFIDDNSVGAKVWAQYRFSKLFALEGAYHNSGDLEDIVVTSGDSTDFNIKFDGFSAQALLFLPLTPEDIEVYVKAGYYDFDDELSVDGSVTSNGSESGLVAGAGAEISLADNFAIRADLDWFDADVGDLWAVNLGVQYYFGGQKAEPVAMAAEAPPPPPPPPPPMAAPDADADGVADAADRCPATPAGDRVDERGCSCDVTRQLQFEFDSDQLTDEDKVVLDEVAGNLTVLGFVGGTIEGHTDSEGEEDYNLDLSKRRAQTVASYLEAKGIARGRIKVVGMGESMPISDNDTEEGRALNRRVVLRREDCAAGN